MKARRYQLTKDTAAIIARGHPWVFRDALSSAAVVFADGDWLRLVDGQNRVVAHGIFEAEGAIAIRVLRRGPDRPDARWVADTLALTLARRATLADRTDGIRLVHGESDGLPAVVVDRFGDTLVASSYSAGADALARYVAIVLARMARAALEQSIDPSNPIDAARVIGPARHVVLRTARRRHGEPATAGARALLGAPPAVATFTEDGLELAVDLDAGQKTGAYLDLRGLRHALATAPLAGARVLNLFAYSGMLGRAAEAAGAAAITQVDASEAALAFARAHHVVEPARHAFVEADIFQWLPALSRGEAFDLVIVDPPAMTSKKGQVPAVLAGYRKLYRAAAPHVKVGGVLVAACCTSRVERQQFHRTVRETLGDAFTMEREIPPEVDHPVGFAQADYLKIGWWRRTK